MKKTFRDKFKFYKRKDIPSDYSDVIDFNALGKFRYVREKVIMSNSDKVGIDWKLHFGMENPCQWKVYEFISQPGLVFIKNPFQSLGQRYWIIRCLENYTKKPNKLNIDAHNLLDTSDDWWEYCQRNHGTDMGKLVLEKLRWATLGYHHNWDCKEYSESYKSEFPEDLKVLCSLIADTLNFEHFVAEAAIINFYHFNSSLSGHVDHSEINLEAPLFSFSFGQSAIFLIGGKSLEEDALPLLVESGDILIMSGESRLCYHGVPRILPAITQPWNHVDQSVSRCCVSDHFAEEVTSNLLNHKQWDAFDSYLSKSRININIRQVLHHGQKTLNTC